VAVSESTLGVGAEGLAIYGLIDAETYIQLTEAMIAGSMSVRECLPRLDRRTVQWIRARAAELWRQGRIEAADIEGNSD
jgi:hypothetical protein